MSPKVDLSEFDLILVNSSAGKDSQAMLTRLVEMADEQGVDRDRFLVVHADLGRVEWEGVRELAEEQADAYGLRFVTVHRAKGDLLDQAEFERKMWPSSTARWCTSDQKTSQVVKQMTAEVTAWRERTGLTRPMRILNCLGIRAAESPARAKKQPLHRDAASNGKRDVTRWLPIFDWSDEQVWQTIRRSGLRHHPAYDAGMPRLSCVFCVLAGRRELTLAARLNPALAAEYVAVEARIGHTFRADLSMAQIVEDASRPDVPVEDPLTLFDCSAA